MIGSGRRIGKSGLRWWISWTVVVPSRTGHQPIPAPHGVRHERAAPRRNAGS